MILPDVNILIHAINKDSSKHDKIRRWWETVLSGVVPVYIPWVVILGFIRISTNRKIFQSPLSIKEACAYVQEWLHRPCVRIAEPGEGHWEIVKKLLEETRNGELTTDAHLAALAMQLNCVLYSTDTDYKRFPRLKWEYF